MEALGQADTQQLLKLDTVYSCPAMFGPVQNIWTTLLAPTERPIIIVSLKQKNT